MAKSLERLEAIRLREQGESVRDIANKLGVSRSTASLWVRHVILLPEQIEILLRRKLKGKERGRLSGSNKLKLERLEKVEREKQMGAAQFENISPRELMIAGLCLYWAEGNKTNRRICFSNSDPRMIKFMIKWLEEVYLISRLELSCYVGINEAHRYREEVVKDFWSKITGIPVSNFTKTSFKQYPLRKVYENFDSHFGTFVMTVRKPARIYYKIQGQIDGLSSAT